MTPELQNTLAALANKLGTSVERLWPILVAEKRLDSIIAIVIGATFTTLAVIFFRKGLEADDEMDRAAVLVVTSIAFVIGVLVAGGFVSSAVYPEAAVITKLLGR